MPGLLDSYEDTFSKCDASVDDFPQEDKVPDNLYMMQLARINYCEIKPKDGGPVYPMVFWNWTIRGGDYLGCLIVKKDRLVTKENVEYFKKALYKLNYDVDTFRLIDLEGSDPLRDLIGVCAQVKLETKGEWQNFYIQKMVTLDEVERDAQGDQGGWASEDPEDDEPEDDEPDPAPAIQETSQEPDAPKKDDDDLPF